MAATPKELYQRAMSLSEQDRAELVGLLLESLELEEDADVESKWLAEIERRMEKLDSGVTQSVPWSEVRLRVFNPNAG